jgi:hypothetical protein
MKALAALSLFPGLAVALPYTREARMFPLLLTQAISSELVANKPPREEIGQLEGADVV